MSSIKLQLNDINLSWKHDRLTVTTKKTLSVNYKLSILIIYLILLSAALSGKQNCEDISQVLRNYQ